MLIREPVVAGMFYQAHAITCRHEAEQLFKEASAALDGPEGLAGRLPKRIVGGIVPHAGWTFSGEPAARTLEAIARRRVGGRGSGVGDQGSGTRDQGSGIRHQEIESPRPGVPASPRPSLPTPDPRPPAPVFVIFGAMHRARGRDGLLFDRGVWRTPLGDVEIDQRLAERILGNTNLICGGEPALAAHSHEHSIEVQIPLIQVRFPDARIVPILVPPSEQAHEIGLAVGRTLEIFGVDAVVLGSTDLTHYGPRYMFIPHGPGAGGMKWAKQVNDAGLIDAVVRLDAQGVVAESSEKLNACGGGAVAATLAAARKLGATRGVVLEHVTSYEVMLQRFSQRSDDAVSYLSAVLG